MLSNIVYEFQRQLPREQAQEAGYGLAALIDGLWLRAALSGKTARQKRVPKPRRPFHQSVSATDFAIMEETMSRMAEQQLYIHGKFVAATSGKTFETINPCHWGSAGNRPGRRA